MSNGCRQFVAEHPLTFSEIRIENTTHCGYKCFFCPRESLTRRQGFMSVEDFGLAIHRVGRHDTTVDLHGYGEPLLDQALIPKVELLTKHWPKCRPRIISSLGVPLSRTYFAELIKAGIQEVEVSFYGFTPESYEASHGSDMFSVARRNLEALCIARDAFNPALDITLRLFPVHSAVLQPLWGAQQRVRFTQWLLSLGITRLRTRDLHNFGAGRKYNPPGSASLCSIVWGYRRRILQITWDLNVIPCCFDFNAEIVFGNLRDSSLAEIFTGSTYRKFIRDHTEGRLDEYKPCANCEKCYRP